MRLDEAGYCATPEENVPWLSPEIRSDIAAGDGGELSERSGRVKICALHSSSGLVANVFGYWTDHDASGLASALRLSTGIKEIRFERKYDTGLGGRSPNVDFTVACRDESVLAVESKFEESYWPKRRTLRDSYFPPGVGLWAQDGLPGAQAAAEAIYHEGGSQFRGLDAPQLLKHMLGPAKTGIKAWHLLLLWYEAPAAASVEVRREIDHFRLLLAGDAERFETRTYQEVWLSLAEQLTPDHYRYRTFVGSRYFLR